MARLTTRSSATVALAMRHAGLAAIVHLGAAAEGGLRLTIQAGAHACHDAPIDVALTAATDLPGEGAEVRLADGRSVPAQLTGPGLLAAAGTVRELHFVLGALDAGATATATVRFTPAAAPPRFAWRDVPGEGERLDCDGAAVLRAVHPVYDHAKAGATCKVFHHVYDPAGDLLLTKGPGGLFPHHRGIFFGYMKVAWAGRSVDIWHCRDDAHQAYGRSEEAAAGAVLGRQRLLIHWNAAPGETFADEERELTAWRLPGGTLIGFASRLRSTVGALTLDGDPQHAGVHFRATDEVASATKGQTRFIRPDSVGAPGAARNWPAKEALGLPWDAMAFAAGGAMWTVAYLDHPANPGPARGSEREYGRIGSFVPVTLAADAVLELRYRFRVEAGTMAQEAVAAASADFTAPPTVAVERLP